MLEIDSSRGFPRYAFACKQCGFHWLDRFGKRVWIDPLPWAIVMYESRDWDIVTGAGAYALCPTCAKGAK